MLDSSEKSKTTSTFALYMKEESNREKAFTELGIKDFVRSYINQGDDAILIEIGKIIKKLEARKLYDAGLLNLTNKNNERMFGKPLVEAIISYIKILKLKNLISLTKGKTNKIIKED